MNPNYIIEELSREYGAILLLAAYIMRETGCSVDEAHDRAYNVDFYLEQMLAEQNDDEE